MLKGLVTCSGRTVQSGTRAALQDRAHFPALADPGAERKKEWARTSDIRAV